MMKEYFVVIEGKTWYGDDAELSLRFYERPTFKDVKEKSGDFQSYEIVNSYVMITLSEPFAVQED
jgi:hypothetical protein